MRKKVNMDFFMWCVVFPILCLLIIREKFPGLISKIVKGFGKVIGIGVLLGIGNFLVVKIGWLWLFVIFGGAFLLYTVIFFTLVIRSVREENRRKYGKKDKRVI